MKLETVCTYDTPTPFNARTMVGDTVDRATLMGAAGALMEASHTVHVNQVHGNTVMIADGDTPSGLDGDAIICREPGVLIGVFTADCVPIVITGPDVVGVIHAGWRGFAADIFTPFFQQLDLPGKQLFAHIGPSICVDCYEVGTAVASHFRKDEVRQANGNRPHLNLWQASINRLSDQGIPRSSIHLSERCTACESPALPSYRREKTDRRLLTAIIQRDDEPLHNRVENPKGLL